MEPTSRDKSVCREVAGSSVPGAASEAGRAAQGHGRQSLTSGGESNKCSILRPAFPLLTEGKRSPGRTVGLDTVGLSFSVEPDYEVRGGTLTVRNMGVVGQEGVTCRQSLPGGGFVALGKGGKAWVEASAKRAGDGSNVVALSAAEASESMREACREALTFCSTRTPFIFEDAGVVRLDVVRDFDEVGHVGDLLDGLASTPRDGRYKVRRFADSQRRQAETLTVGPKAHHGTLYDKWAETGGEAPVGRVRCESRNHQDQLSSVWARDQGVTVRWMGEVTQEKIERLGRVNFVRYGFDREVVGMASLSSKVFGAEGLSRFRQAMLFAFLVAPGFAGGLSKASRSEYRAMARELGVSMRPGDEVYGAEPVSVRLDFESGREVCRAA